MENNQYIYIDFSKAAVPAVAYAKKGDRGARVLSIVPFSDGVDMKLESGTTARLHIHKPDGKAVLTDCTIEERTVTMSGSKASVIRAELPDQALTAVGTATAEIGLYQDDKLLSSQTFYLEVADSAIPDGEIESSDDFRSFSEALSRVSELEEEVNALDILATNAADKAESAETKAASAEKTAETLTESFEELSTDVKKQLEEGKKIVIDCSKWPADKVNGQYVNVFVKLKNKGTGFGVVSFEIRDDMVPGTGSTYCYTTVGTDNTHKGGYYNNLYYDISAYPFHMGIIAVWGLEDGYYNIGIKCPAEFKGKITVLNINFAGDFEIVYPTDEYISVQELTGNNRADFPATKVRIDGFLPYNNTINNQFSDMMASMTSAGEYESSYERTLKYTPLDGSEEKTASTDYGTRKRTILKTTVQGNSYSKEFKDVLEALVDSKPKTFVGRSSGVSLPTVWEEVPQPEDFRSLYQKVAALTDEKIKTIVEEVLTEKGLI